MDRPSVSVVTPNYNHARFLATSIESVLAQSRPPDEYIILDDASSDSSIEVIESYANNNSAMVVTMPKTNQGMISTLNELLEMARGDYIMSLAADDYMLPGFLERSMDMLTMHPEAGFCSTLSLMVDEAGRKLGLFPSPIPSFRPVFIDANRARRVLCRYGAWFLGNTTVFRRQALLNAGGFRSELLSFTDGFISHVLALKHGACFIPDPLGAWRQMEGGESGLTTRDDDRATEVITKAVELMTTSPEYSHLFPRQYVRNWLTRRLYWAGDAALTDLGKAHARLSQTLDGRHVRPNLIDRILNT